MKFKLSYILILFFIVFLMSFVSASDGLTDEKNISFEEQANICLVKSRQILNELINENFSILRVNDSLNQAEDIFDSQVILKQKNKQGFALVLPYCEEIKTIREKAFEARDEFTALEIFYDELIVEEMDATSVDKIFLEIENEIESERYEKVKSLVDKAYEEIINVKSDYTALNIFYKTVTKNLRKFLDENWIYLVSGFIILIVLFFIYKNTIFQGIIKWKINRLGVRRDSIKGLIKTTQNEYFNQGNISERIYTIKIKKFAEFIRDIDRQIPLLQERLFKILRKQKSDEKSDKKSKIFGSSKFLQKFKQEKNKEIREKAVKKKIKEKQRFKKDFKKKK